MSPTQKQRNSHANEMPRISNTARGHTVQGDRAWEMDKTTPRLAGALLALADDFSLECPHFVFVPAHLANQSDDPPAVPLPFLRT